MSKPWFKIPDPINKNAHIAILGGGIAGIMTAFHLKEAGFKTTIIEKNNKPLGEASGNPAAILEPFLTAAETVESEFFLPAYLYALEYYKNIGRGAFTPTGLLKMPKNNQEKERFKSIADLFGPEIAEIENDNLVLANSGYILPSLLRKYATAELNWSFNCRVSRLENADNNRWKLNNDQGNEILTADAVIICNSHCAKLFEQIKRITFDDVTGQISVLAPEYTGGRILNSKGYLTPIIKTEHGEAHICGATFEREGGYLTAELANAENIAKSPYKFENPQILDQRRSIRAMSPDHIPSCGPAPDFEAYQDEYEGLHYGPFHRKFAQAPYHKNLFVNVGLGSRGFLTAPILGKYLSSILAGNPLPFSAKICNALHPGRFVIRQLSKK